MPLQRNSELARDICKNENTRYTAYRPIAEMVRGENMEK